MRHWIEYVGKLRGYWYIIADVAGTWAPIRTRHCPVGAALNQVLGF